MINKIKILFLACASFLIFSNSARAVRPYTSPEYSTATGKADMSLVGNFKILKSTNDNTALIVLSSTGGVSVTYGIIVNTATITGLLSGTSAQFSKFVDFRSSTTFSGLMSIGSVAASGWINASGSNTLSGLTAMTSATVSGTIGIGTTSPSSKVDIAEGSVTIRSGGLILSGSNTNILVGGSSVAATLNDLSDLESAAGLTPTTTVQVTSTFGANFSTITGIVGNNTTSGGNISSSYNGRYVALSRPVTLISNNFAAQFSTAPNSATTVVGNAVSESGQVIIINRQNAVCLKSNDYGVSFTTLPIASSERYGKVAISSSGLYMGFTSNAGYVNVSSDSGVSFSSACKLANWRGVVCSTDGKYWLASVHNDGFFQSGDYGVTWATCPIAAPTQGWGIAMSANGKYRLTGSDTSGGILSRSDDYGVTYTTASVAADAYGGASIDWSGQYQAATTDDKIIVSTNYGVSFTTVTTRPAEDFSSHVAISGNARYIFLGGDGATTLYKSELLNYIGGGAIGLNTSTPSSKLDVINGSITVRGEVPGISIRNYNDEPYFTVTNAGLVGIGIENPTYVLQVNGQPAANGYTAWTNYSDKRLKKNESDITESVLPKLRKLKPVEFEYSDDYYKKTGYNKPTESRKLKGFNAQDIKEIFPEMVGMRKISGPPYASTETAKTVEFDVEITTDTGYGQGSRTITQHVTQNVPAKEVPENTAYYDLNLSNLQIYLTKAIQEMLSAFCVEFPLNAVCVGGQ